MSEAYKVEQIRALKDAITQFRHISRDLQNYQIQTLAHAGSSQWSGYQKNQYNVKLDNAQTNLNQAKQQVEQAISDCKARQWSLAWSIDGEQHPLLFAQAMQLAGSF